MFHGFRIFTCLVGGEGEHSYGQGFAGDAGLCFVPLLELIEFSEILTSV